VPIALLHQKVYSTSHRLEPLEHIVVPKRRSLIVPFNVVKTEPVIQSVNPTRNNPLGHPFEVTPYFRRYFVRMHHNDWLTCRFCGLIARDPQDRSKHNFCFRKITEILDKMSDQGICAICEAPFEPGKRSKDVEWYGIPVCDKVCLDTWDVLNSQGFEFEVSQAMKEGDLTK
jgi:hypothetical protein